MLETKNDDEEEEVDDIPQHETTQINPDDDDAIISEYGLDDYDNEGNEYHTFSIKLQWDNVIEY